MRYTYVTIMLIMLGIFSSAFSSTDTNQFDICTLPEPPQILIQTDGSNITSQGIIRACVILIDKEGENFYSDSTIWPPNGEPNPEYTFLNSQPSQTQWISNNMSRYTYEMSNGIFQIIGDVFRYTLPANFNFTSESSAGLYALQQLDNVVDFSQYDNWKQNSQYQHINEPDGEIDYLWIVFRSALKDYNSSIYYTGRTGTPPFVSNDVVMINGSQTNISANNRGSFQGGYASGFDYIQGVCMHEISHYLFPWNGIGSHNGRLVGLSSLSGNQVGYGQNLVGMNAWERERLAWISYIDVDSDQTVTLSDYMSTGMAVKIPTNTPGRHYIIENRQKQTMYDRAWGKGLYIYIEQSIADI